MRRHLLEKVGVTEVGHLEQLDTTLVGRHAPRPLAARRRATSRSSRAASSPQLPPGHRVAPGRRAAADRVRPRRRGRTAPTSACAASSRTRTPRSRSRRRASRCASSPTSTRPCSATPSTRRTSAACSSATTSSRRPAGGAATGGRPAEEFTFSDDELVVSRPLAAFRASSEEREVERRRRVRERAERDEVDARSRRPRAGRRRVIPPLASSSARPATCATVARSSCRRHVVEQQARRARGERLVDLGARRGLDLEQQVGPRARAPRATAAAMPPAAATWFSLMRIASKRPKRWFVPAARGDRRLLERPQPRRRLARVEDARARCPRPRGPRAPSPSPRPRGGRGG